MSVVPPVAAAQNPRFRRDAVDPYLERIEADGASAPGDGASGSRITIENRVIDLNRWEWSVLAKGLKQRERDSPPAEIEGWPGRLAEGVAFQARYLTHVSRIQDGPPPAPNELDAFREELITDTALGLALQEELQRDVDNLVALGELDGAKKLTAFRHKIGQSLGRLKDLVGEAGFRRAEDTAAGIAAPAPKQARPQKELELEEEEEAEAPTQFRRDVSVGPVQYLAVKRPNRLRQLALVLVGCIALSVVVNLLMRRAAGPPVLPAQTFRGIDGVRQVVVRPPSLFVTVDGSSWRDMTDDDRKALVDRVGEIARGAGYSGAHFRDASGVGLAQWMARGGTRLIEAPPDEGGGT